MTDYINEIFLDDELQREANRKALLLAQTRFTAQIRPFIEGKPERLAYVRSDLERIVIEASAAVNADELYVSDRFKAYVADAVAVSEPQRIDLDADREESLPPPKNDPAKKNPEPDAETTVLDHGTVLEEEATEPDARVDLNEDTAKASCFRCNATLNPVVAAASKVCIPCRDELAKLADASPLAVSPPQGTGTGISPANPNQLVQCDFCAAKGYHFEGTQAQVQDHINTQHQQELQQTLQQQHQQPVAVGKVGAPEDVTPPDPASDTVKADEGLSDEANPVHHFDDVIQRMADRAAAVQFSTPSDEEIQAIADQYGLDPDEIRDKLFVTATFGEFTGANGSVGDASVPDGYTEIDMEGMGGRVDSHDAQVPYELARNQVANDLGMESNLVDNMLKDAYGGDLGDQYHASVSGEHRYFLPTEIADAIKKQEPPPAAPPDPAVGPTPQPVSHRVSIADIINEDRRRTLARRHT
jgi:hypothetical protein